MIIIMTHKENMPVCCAPPIWNVGHLFSINSMLSTNYLIDLTLGDLEFQVSDLSIAPWFHIAWWESTLSVRVQDEIYLGLYNIKRIFVSFALAGYLLQGKKPLWHPG